MAYTFGQRQLDGIEEILQQDFIGVGVHCAVLIDLAGNVIGSDDNGDAQYDIYSIAALAAANFGAVSAMAKIIGEEEFSLLFHKGRKESIHFSKVMDDFLLVTIFDKEVSLGFLRLKVAEAIGKIENIFKS
ncbi:MAG: roadblock/LC7 domain-containing protein [Thermodesulfobacteriota bacterium]|nr:roadblock/LC7 domain-containing protein [Thermodesulfobacteriota bacterium]